jgi:hypothetical protein
MKDSRPCKYAAHFSDWVPTPFGSGNCEMPGFECEDDGDLDFWDDDNFICNEDRTCPAYHPVPLMYCHKHHEIYYDSCPKCEDEMYGEGL